MLRFVELLATLRRLVGGMGSSRPPGRAAPADPALLQALANLERFALLGRMTAAFAHDMRTPLHVIASVAETALGELPRGSSLRGEMTAVRRNCQVLSSGLDRLLDFSRGRRPQESATRLEALAEEAVKLLEPTCAKRGVKIRCRWGRGRPVRVEPGVVSGVVLNLILNAAEAMPGGGVLTVSTGSDANGGWIRVADTGAGMSPRELRQLGSPGATTKADGRGMGLYLCRMRLEDQGGRLAFSSARGRGTVAKVSLPKR